MYRLLMGISDTCSYILHIYTSYYLLHICFGWLSIDMYCSLKLCNVSQATNFQLADQESIVSPL